MSPAPLPPKPAFSEANPPVYYVTAARVFNAWRRRRVSDAFAVGMLAQADMESAFRTDLVGDHGQAYSMYQWHWVPRGQAILNATGVDVRNERNVDRIVEAAWWELAGAHGMGEVERRAFQLLKSAPDAAFAARAACTYFEGAGAADAAERRAHDAEFWATWVQRNLSWVAAQG